MAKKRNISSRSTIRRLVFGLVLLLIFPDVLCCIDSKDAADTKSATFPITVDYNQSLSQMIGAGRYDYAAKQITSDHFPLDGKGKVDTEVVLLNFQRELSMDEVLKEFNRLGYRAATLPEMLAFGAKYPNVQRKHIVVELGSLWRNKGKRTPKEGIRVCAYLRGTPGQRAVDIHFVDSPAGRTGKWIKESRFLAVRVGKPRRGAQ